MPSPDSWGLRGRLAFMMFLHFFSLGAVMPVLSLYCTSVLGLSNGETGVILATGSLATALMPLLTAWIADRYISGRHLLVVLNLVAGVFFLWLISQRDFWGVLWGYTLLMVAKGPTFALANSVTFQHLSDREKYFPRIRLWGTVGWITVGWFVTFTWFSGFGGQGFSFTLMLGALSSFFLGLYAMTLPPTPLFPREKKPKAVPVKRTSGSRASWNVSLIVFLLVTVLISVVDKFYFYGAGIHASQLGIPAPWILPAMSLGQGMEVLAMAFMAYILPRWGFRRVFLLGIAWQVLRFAVLSAAGVPGVFLVGVGIHGLCFAFFLANAFVYIDSRTTPAQRSRVHQLYMFMVEGVGVVLGNLGAGFTAGLLSTPAGVNFGLFWWVPGILAVVSLVLMVLFFRPDAKVPSAAGDPAKT